MTCEECKASRAKENAREKMMSVPYVVHESAMSRADRRDHRQWATIIILIFLLVASNCAWLVYESQFEEVSTTTETYEVDAEDGGNAVINDDGSVTINGES